MKSIFIDYGLLQVFWYFFKSPLCYENEKKYSKNSYNVIIIYNIVVLSHLST
jgi:hypothetical protein